MRDGAGNGQAPVEPLAYQPFDILGGTSDGGLILLCDHATNILPAEYGSLGLPPEQLKRHIAYDIGAGGVVRRLASALDVAAVFSRFSRLLVDPNRGLDDPTLIMRLSDGVIVPGNQMLSRQEREKRIAFFWQPYHAAIDRLIEASLACGVAPALLSIHSFTESWKGVPRPWHAGVLWDRDGRLARPLLNGLFAQGDIIVGDNEPYSGRLHGDTMWRHGSERGLAHALVEIRQDLIRDEAGQAAWAGRLEGLVRGLAGAQELAVRLRPRKQVASVDREIFHGRAHKA